MPENSPQNLRLVRCIRDKQVARVGKSILRGEEQSEIPFLSLFQFLGYGAATLSDEIPTEEMQQECLKKLDRRLSKLISSIQSNSLVVLLATGKTRQMRSGERSMGHCYLKITR